jgi:uncharacterized heparinase superfamily protein
MMAGVLRWWHTIRYLRPVQIYGRLWFRLHRPRIDESPGPTLRTPQQPFVSTAWRAASLIGEDTFRFLNEAHGLTGMQGWNDPGIGRLWRYNLHYFDDLTATGAETRTHWHQALLLRWVQENPPGKGTGWEPYPTSLRLVNWLRWHLAGNQLPDACVQSMAIQTRWLSGHLEHHLLGNHLWANAKALVFAGACFEGREAAGWLGHGLRLLQRELREQVLPDGGHFERSPMYHAIMLADLLDLLALAKAFPGVLPEPAVLAWRAAVVPMLRWLAAMTHPDGEIALFNDAALNIAPRLTDLEAYARALDIELASLETASMQDLADSGYVRMQIGPAVLIADAGMIGPDYIPGHAHADTLSFELSLFGRRVVVDSGTSCYEASAERLRQRGTAAHNTVQIDGEDSSEVWGSFRVARRARPFDRTLDRDDSGLTLACAHDGYRRLPGKPAHRRHWHLAANHLTVQDTVEGPYRQAVARYHFHPDVRVDIKSDGRGLLYLPDGTVATWKISGGHANLSTSSYHPEFNISLPCQCLEIAVDNGECTVEFAWQSHECGR